MHRPAWIGLAVAANASHISQTGPWILALVIALNGLDYAVDWGLAWPWRYVFLV